MEWSSSPAQSYQSRGGIVGHIWLLIGGQMSFPDRYPSKEVFTTILLGLKLQFLIHLYQCWLRPTKHKAVCPILFNGLSSRWHLSLRRIFTRMGSISSKAFWPFLNANPLHKVSSLKQFLVFYFTTKETWQNKRQMVFGVYTFHTWLSLSSTSNSL